MAPDALSTPGKRIRFLRQAKGWSQETLAQKVPVSQPAVAQWEADKYRPHPAIQAVLAEALNTSRGFLFGEGEAA